MFFLGGGMDPRAPMVCYETLNGKIKWTFLSGLYLTCLFLLCCVFFLQYQLDTFTEGRKTAWAYTPYTGQPIDGPQNGVPPGPWNINIQPGEMFKDHEKHVEVPHTASVKVCHGCMGMGMNRCWKCRGRGQVRGRLTAGGRHVVCNVCVT